MNHLGASHFALEEVASNNPESQVRVLYKM